MKLKILSVLILMLALFLKTTAQNVDLPQNKYRDGENFKELFKQTRRDLKGFSFSLGYIHTQFLNSRYGLLSEEKYIKQPFGLVLSFRQPIYPVFIDINMFQCFYKTDLPSSVDNSKLNFRGIDFSISLALFPISAKVARIIVPYGGVGYRLAGLVESKSNLSIKSNTIFSVVNVSGPYWKFGIMINPVRKLTINFEYRQAFPLKSEKAIAQYFFTIGYKFNRNH